MAKNKREQMEQKLKSRYSESEIKSFISSLPYGKEGVDFKSGPLVAVGWKNFEKYLKTRGRPKKPESEKAMQVTIRLKAATIGKLQMKRGWQTKLREYVETGVSTGAL